MLNDIPNRIKYTKRNDGYIISTIKSRDSWYGKYETAIRPENDVYGWRIAEGYETKDEALKGHEKYITLSGKEIERVNYIG